MSVCLYVCMYVYIATNVDKGFRKYLILALSFSLISATYMEQRVVDMLRLGCFLMFDIAT